MSQMVQTDIDLFISVSFCIMLELKHRLRRVKADVRFKSAVSRCKGTEIQMKC